MHVFSGHQRHVCFGLVVSGVLAGAIPVIAADASEKYTLRYKFLAAKNVGYTVENISAVELHQGEAEQQVQHRELTDKHYQVINVDLQGNCILDLSIDRVQMSAAVDGGESVEFDSRTGDAPPPEFEGVAEKIGQPHVRVKVSPLGEVLSLQWLQKDEQQPLTAKNAGNLDILMRLPEEPVGIGDVWKERFETDISVGESLQKAVTIQRTYRLTAVNGNVASIQLDTSVITPLREPEQEAQLIQKTPSGTIEFDLERGLMLSRQTKVDQQVVGFSGPKSFIRNVTTRTERYVESGGSPVVHQAGDTDAVRR